VQSQVRSWRRLEERVRAWSGAWIGVHTGGLGRSDRTSSRKRDRALRFLGFRALEAGLEVRPANLAGGARRAREELLALGLDADALVFTLDDLDAATDDRARRLWDGEALAAGYRSATRELEESAARLPSLESARAMVESFVLGGRVIRELVLDPLLPEPIVDVAARRALGEAMLRYDRLGRAAWRDFLRDYGVTGREAPVEIGWSAPGDRLLHA
jgi:phenylacetic acid degradation operon negative regulatory protein